MFLGRGTIIVAYLAMSVATAIALLLFGVLIFNKVEKTFVDTV
jgi:lipopolysaccharide transport system permease protein